MTGNDVMMYYHTETLQTTFYPYTMTGIGKAPLDYDNENLQTNFLLYKMTGNAVSFVLSH